MFRWQRELFCIMVSMNSWFRWLVAGLLLGIGFVLPILWPLGLIGGAYFLFLLREETNKRKIYFGAWLAWSIKSAFATSVFWSVYPIEWLPIDFGNIQLALIFIYWFTASLWLGGGALVVVLLYKFFQKNILAINKNLIFLIFPIIWVLGEVIGSLIFSVMMIGPGGSINASYSLGYVGYLLTENNLLLQFARLGGVYSLSFLFTASSVALYLAFSVRKKVYQYIIVGLLVFVYLTSFFTFYTSTNVPVKEGYKVVTIDTNFPKGPALNRESSMIISNNLNDAVMAALAEDPDYILLPEDARYFDQQRPVSAVKSLFQLQFDNPEVTIIDSGRVELNDKIILQAFVYNGPGNPVERFHKRYLVPQGEYMPSLYSGFLGLLGYGKTADYLSSVISYEVGSKTSQANVASNIPGVLFCFESVSPYGVRTLVKERPTMPFVAHQISHAWFHDSNILWHQLDSMLKVQAVWNHQYIVSAGNHVSGQVITPGGNMVPLQVVASDELWTVKTTKIPKVY